MDLGIILLLGWIGLFPSFLSVSEPDSIDNTFILLMVLLNINKKPVFQKEKSPCAFTVIQHHRIYSIQVICSDEYFLKCYRTDCVTNLIIFPWYVIFRQPLWKITFCRISTKLWAILLKFLRLHLGFQGLRTSYKQN